jgi:hypothetical protein
VLVPNVATVYRCCELSPTGEKRKDNLRSPIKFTLSLLSLDVTDGEEQKTRTYKRNQQRGLLQTVQAGNRIHMAQDQILNFGLTLISEYLPKRKGVIGSTTFNAALDAVISGKNLSIKAASNGSQHHVTGTFQPPTELLILQSPLGKSSWNGKEYMLGLLFKKPRKFILFKL